MHIIRTGQEDAARMAGIHARVIPRPWVEEEFAALLKGKGCFGFRSGARRMDGFILCRAVGDECELLTFAVVPEKQHRGIGWTLLVLAMAEAGRYGARSMFLEVAEDNVPALMVYHKAGFKETGRRPGYYSAGLRTPKDALVMRADLA